MTAEQVDADARRRAREKERADEHLRIRHQRIAQGGLEAASEFAGTVGDRHYVAWVDTVKDLKRRGLLTEALRIVYACIEATETASGIDGMLPSWYTEQAAIIHRKLGQYVEEIAVCRRFADHVYGRPEWFDDRIEKAFALLKKQECQS